MKYMTGNEIRKAYLQFFKSKEHLILHSFPLIPENDPSLLLIGVQFPFLGAGGSSFICSWAAVTLLLCSTIPTRQGSRELLAASQITEEDVS